VDGLQLPFSEASIRRYSRQILLREVGGAGQKRLLAATVAVTGDGPAARVCALYLAAAGVGTVLSRADLTRARAVNPELRVAAAGPPDLVAQPAHAISPADAWVQGALAAIEALKRILALHSPAPPGRLEPP